MQTIGYFVEMKNLLHLLLISISVLLTACEKPVTQMAGFLSVVGDAHLIVIHHERKIEPIEFDKPFKVQLLGSGHYTAKLHIENKKLAGIYFTEILPTPEDLEENSEYELTELEPEVFFLRLPKTSLENLSKKRIEFTAEQLGQELGLSLGLDEFAIGKQDLMAGKKFTCSDDSSIIYDPRVPGYIQYHYVFTIQFLDPENKPLAIFAGDELIDNTDGETKKQFCDDLRKFKSEVNSI